LIRRGEQAYPSIVHLFFEARQCLLSSGSRRGSIFCQIAFWKGIITNSNAGWIMVNVMNRGSGPQVADFPTYQGVIEVLDLRFILHHPI
jgi:hypothetical protein